MKDARYTLMQNLEKCSKTILFYLLMTESFGVVQIRCTFIEYTVRIKIAELVILVQICQILEAK